MYLSIANFINKKFRIDAHYFLKGGFWLSVGQSLTIICGIVTTALFAHYLPEAQYGIYRYLVSLSALATALSLTGLGQSILQATSKGFLNFYKETLRINLLYSLGISVVGLFGFGYYFLQHNEILAYGCLAIAVFQPAIVTFQNSHVFLQGQKRFRESTYLVGFKTIFVSTVSVASLLFTQDVLFLFLSFIFSSALSNFLAHQFFINKIYQTTQNDFFKKYLSYARHTSLRNVISLISLRIDAIIIFTQLGATQLAIYSIAIVIPEQIKASLKNLASLLIQKYANHDDKNLLLQSVPRRSVQLFCLLFFLTIIYIAIAPFLYGLLFPKYPEAIFLSQLYSLAFLTHILYIPHSILQVQMREETLYYLSTAGAVFLIALMLILIPLYGILGAIISTLTYRLVFTFLTFVALKKSS